MSAYYNEIDPFAADWLRNLISAGLIAPGEVDTRSIKDVTADDVRGFTQCHFFAGIGGWSQALRLADWPDDVAVWSGSCPCQPFSSAGKRKGADDERHLWPEFRRLIAECRPAITFGEQVASKDGRAWLARVRLDLEELGYAVGAADLCAAGEGAPHIRQRLWWVADANEPQFRGQPRAWEQSEHESNGCAVLLGDADGARRLTRSEERQERIGEGVAMPATGGEVCGVGDTEGIRLHEQSGVSGVSCGSGVIIERKSSDDGRTIDWSDFSIIPCTDGKSRRVESGSQPLAARIPRDVGPMLAELRTMEPDSKAARRLVAIARRNRTGRLKGYGNSIVPQVAAQFIAAFSETNSKEISNDE